MAILWRSLGLLHQLYVQTHGLVWQRFRIPCEFIIIWWSANSDPILSFRSITLFRNWDRDAPMTSARTSKNASTTISPTTARKPLKDSSASAKAIFKWLNPVSIKLLVNLARNVYHSNKSSTHCKFYSLSFHAAIATNFFSREQHWINDIKLTPKLTPIKLNNCIKVECSSTRSMHKSI